jgi:hypothetical protein
MHPRSHVCSIDRHVGKIYARYNTKVVIIYYFHVCNMFMFYPIIILVSEYEIEERPNYMREIVNTKTNP